MFYTIKLRFYWPFTRHEVSQHGAECSGCALRSRYHSQPKIPVLEYPEVIRPMVRMHIGSRGNFRNGGGYGGSGDRRPREYDPRGKGVAGTVTQASGTMC